VVGDQLEPFTGAVAGPPSRPATAFLTELTMTTTGNVTQIDANYLNGLKTQLQTILTDVQNQLRGIGASSDPDTTSWLGPVDQTLSVSAGATSFNAGTDLNTALKNMGGSVNEQLTWLQKVLTDMINEITTTVNSFSASETLNNESVAQLISDFESTIGDMNNPPGGSSSGNPNTGNSNS
jgi:hypothetical protein